MKMLIRAKLFGYCGVGLISVCVNVPSGYSLVGLMSGRVNVYRVSLRRLLSGPVVVCSSYCQVGLLPVV